jgi:exodeoxyribonuclease-5
MADQMPVLPGEVLISRTAVMAPASRDGEEAGEEPDMVLGSNREVVVLDVIPESCDLLDFGLTEMNGGVPMIETLSAKVSSGDLELTLRLQPPVGSAARLELDGVMQRLRQQAKEAGKKKRAQHLEAVFPGSRCLRVPRTRSCFNGASQPGQQLR